MDWSWFSTPLGLAMIAPTGAFIGALVGVGITTWTTRTTHRERLTADRELAERKFQFDKDIAERKFKYDRQLSVEKFDFERRQFVNKRRFELAEQVLADAYRFRDLMEYVRNGAAFGNEGQTREAKPGEAENIKRMRDTYFVPFERLQKNSEFISAMMARRYACRTHFGGDAEKAFDAFHSAVHWVRIASSMLVEHTDDRRDLDNNLSEKLLRDIWQGWAEHHDDDRVGQKISEGVALVEGFCRPALEVDEAA